MTDEALDPRAELAKRAAEQLAPSDYQFPGTEIPVKVRLLSEREVDGAKIEAQRYAKKLGADLSLDPDFLDREVQRQIVWRSTFEPIAREGKFVPLYGSDADVRELDTVTLEALWNLYLEHQERKNVLRQLSQETIDKFTTGARANPGSAQVMLSQLDHASLVKLCLSFVAHPPSPDA